MKKPILFLFVIILVLSTKAQNFSIADTNCLPVPWVNADLLENGNILATWDIPCDTCNNVIYQVAYVNGFNPCSGEYPSEGIIAIIGSTLSTYYLLTISGNFPPGAYAIAVRAVYESCQSEWTNSNVVYIR